MSLPTRLRVLRVVLIVVGLIFIVGVYPLMMAWWPAGWRWNPNQPEYEQMILGVYATLGVFLLIASRDPLKHRSLIWFTVCRAWFTAESWPCRRSKCPPSTVISSATSRR